MNYAKLTTRLLASWFLLALGASAGHLFQTRPDQPPILLGLSVLVPLAIFGAWFSTSASFRAFALGLDRSLLTMVQSWRISGFVFLVLYTYQILPGLIALPAGWGDILIGATAPWVARELSGAKHRISFILWQIAGMADLLLAVTLGATAHLIDPNTIPTSAMTALPMSLIPTFAVPLLLILHIICIAQAVARTGQGRLVFEKGLSVAAG